MIKTLEIVQFGGIKNQTILFEDGLNVILGRNEAGKTTIVEAIYAALFVSVKLGNRKSSDKVFMERAFPYESSDFAEVILTFCHHETQYKLHKVWSLKHPKVTLMTETEKILNEEQIDTVLESYLMFNEASYNHIFFSKQERYKKIFEDVQESAVLTQTLGDLLKNAGLDLDGLSVEEFKSRLMMEAKSLDANWDLIHNRPLGGKGIDNPHKRNIGKILEVYYESEKLIRDAREIENVELQIEGHQKQIREMGLVRAEVSERIQLYSNLESDVLKRQEIEQKVDRLIERKVTLLEINKGWPEVELKNKWYQEELDRLEENLSNLKFQLNEWKHYEKHMEQLRYYEKWHELTKELESLNEKIALLNEIDEKTLAQMREVEKTIDDCRLILQSAELGGKVINSNKKISIADLNGQVIERGPGENWISDAYMKIFIEDLIELEIKSNQIDFETVHGTLNENITKRHQLYDQVGVKSLQEALERLENKNKAIADQNILKKQLQMLPEIINENELMENQSKYDQLQLIPKDILENQIEQAIKLQQIKTSERLKFEIQLDSWTKKFQSHDQVAMELGTLIADIRGYETELEKLGMLPQPFTNLTDFLKTLKALRSKKELLTETISGMELELERYFGQLSDKSSTEMLEEADEKIRDRQGYIKKAKQLYTIKETLEGILENQDQEKSPVESIFIRHLEFLTGAQYCDVSIDDHLNIRVDNTDISLPVHLLSSGTLDSVALAFRFAIIETTDPTSACLAILDDCLVNMDETRSRRAIELIQDQAQNRQMIFLTCHAPVADALGGRQTKI